jgi:hypothetical protein
MQKIINKLPISLVLIGVVIFLSIPNKDFLICKRLYDERTIVVKSYMFGLKHTIDNFTLFDCSSSSGQILCRNRLMSNSLDRVTLEYFESDGNDKRYFKCQKVSRGI